MTGEPKMALWVSCSWCGRRIRQREEPSETKRRRGAHLGEGYNEWQRVDGNPVVDGLGDGRGLQRERLVTPAGDLQSRVSGISIDGGGGALCCDACESGLVF